MRLDRPCERSGRLAPCPRRACARTPRRAPTARSSSAAQPLERALAVRQALQPLAGPRRRRPAHPRAEPWRIARSRSAPSRASTTSSRPGRARGHRRTPAPRAPASSSRTSASRSSSASARERRIVVRHRLELAHRASRQAPRRPRRPPGRAVRRRRTPRRAARPRGAGAPARPAAPPPRRAAGRPPRPARPARRARRRGRRPSRRRPPRAPAPPARARARATPRPWQRPARPARRPPPRPAARAARPAARAPAPRAGRPRRRAARLPPPAPPASRCGPRPAPGCARRPPRAAPRPARPRRRARARARPRTRRPRARADGSAKDTSTYASAAAGPTIAASPRAPSTSPSASVSTVLPAPVSPVTTLRPGARSSSALSMRTRFDTNRRSITRRSVACLSADVSTGRPRRSGVDSVVWIPRRSWKEPRACSRCAIRTPTACTRGSAPRGRSPGTRDCAAWLVTGHDACAVVERREDLFGPGMGTLRGAVEITGRRSVLTMEGRPTPSSTGSWPGPWRRARSSRCGRPSARWRRQLLDEVEPEGVVELWERYASPLPVAVVARVLGLEHDRAMLARSKAWMEAVLAWRHTYGEDPEIVEAATVAARASVQDLLPTVRARRDEPADDLISAALARRPDHPPRLERGGRARPVPRAVRGRLRDDVAPHRHAASRCSRPTRRWSGACAPSAAP